MKFSIRSLVCLLVIFIFPLCAYSAPTITSLSPASGPVGGTTQIRIVGTGFVDGASVSFGGNQGSSVYVHSQTTLYADAPAHTAGTVDVTVTNPDLQSSTIQNAYQYIGTTSTNEVGAIVPIINFLLMDD